MAEKILNTRIALKYDLLTNWISSTLVLKTGEIGIAEIPSSTAGSGLTPPAIGIKVGDGVHQYKDLPWIQAVAGDVSAWAKAAQKPSYAATEISAELVTGDGKTVASRLTELEGKADSDTVYRVVKDANVNKWYLQAKDASEADAEFTQISEIDLTNLQENLTFDGTYNASTNKVATESTVSNAIAGLTDTLTGTPGASKTVTAFDEVDGKVTATFADIDITLSQVSDAGDAAAKDVVTVIDDDSTSANYNGNSTDLPTVAAVTTYVDEKTAGLTGAMHFAGAVSAIPPASGTYVSGDVVLLTGSSKEYIFDGTNWKEFGDEGSYALKTITVTAGDGLTGGGNLEANRTISHAVPNTVASDVTAAANTFVKAVTFDQFGHVTSIQTGEATGYTFAEGNVNGAFSVTPDGGSAQSVTIHGLGEAAFVDMADAIADGDTGVATGDQVYDYVDGIVDGLTGSATATAADGNQYSVLTGVSQADGVISKASEVKLAAIAKTGNVNDLIQTSGDVLVLNCGNATA